MPTWPLASGLKAKVHLRLPRYALSLGLDTVLENGSHLWQEKEKAIFDEWRALEYEAQNLPRYLREILRSLVPRIRKTSAWHHQDCLGYLGTTAIYQTRKALLPACDSLVVFPASLPKRLLMPLGDVAGIALHEPQPLGTGKPPHPTSPRLTSIRGHDFLRKEKEENKKREFQLSCP